MNSIFNDINQVHHNDFLRQIVSMESTDDFYLFFKYVRWFKKDPNPWSKEIRPGKCFAAKSTSLVDSANPIFTTVGIILQYIYNTHYTTFCCCLSVPGQ